ncbi:uncharacterized protein LOC128988088 [Macrosteles quadrilineatus]|uniref:uncharacterized protein LOC128988088 n=1 Tax=Macrosteles quadrilineatus TaxID=74068 RepID=UPI0023E2BB3F|nr:uncharacterized protein LOC128988088 [Macrosteles quadrilineatus]
MLPWFRAVALPALRALPAASSLQPHVSRVLQASPRLYVISPSLDTSQTYRAFACTTCGGGSFKPTPKPSPAKSQAKKTKTTEAKKTKTVEAKKTKTAAKKPAAGKKSSKGKNKKPCPKKEEPIEEKKVEKKKCVKKTWHPKCGS